MSDIQPGDLVVCVDASKPRTLPPLKLGAMYRVDFVLEPSWSGTIGIKLVGHPLNRGGRAYRESRFRKLNDGTEDQELIAKIRACKPARTLVEARYPGWQHADQCARYLAQAMSIADREAARRGVVKLERAA